MAERRVRMKSKILLSTAVTIGYLIMVSQPVLAWSYPDPPKRDTGTQFPSWAVALIVLSAVCIAIGAALYIIRSRRPK